MRKLRSADRKCVHRSEDSRSTSKHLALCSALQQGWKVIRVVGKMDADTFRPSWEEKLMESAKALRLAWSSTLQQDNHVLTGSQRCHGNVPGMHRHRVQTGVQTEVQNLCCSLCCAGGVCGGVFLPQSVPITRPLLLFRYRSWAE